MSELSIEDRITKLLENLISEGSEILRDSMLEDIGLDSLAKIEMMMDMEDEFKINIPDEVMSYLESVDELVGYVERVLKNVRT